MAHSDYLLEVRSEEIPARMLRPALRELSSRLFEELLALKMAPREVETGATPRRLVVILRGVPTHEPDRDEESMGPPASIAYDESGAPTKALLGFARRVGLDVGELSTVQTDRGEYVAARLRVEGRPASEVLAELTARLVQGIGWSKTMHWGEGVGPWVRPVHGVLALFGGRIVPFELFGVASGDSTVGHPVLSAKPFRVKGVADYLRKLEQRDILVRFEERREKLMAAFEASAADIGGELVPDDELADRLALTCEIPGQVRGRFDPAFLTLPREVLAASLRDHQSAFTVERDGDLLPYFLTVMDRPDDPEGRVVAGNEWVVGARLADARFFHDEDRKRPLAERRDDLARLTFHVALGSYGDKADRLVRLAETLCSELGWEEELDAAREAAQLLKVDLTTEMVKEFTSLQGVVGGVYARDEGYPEAVWQALYDQYLPASSTDPVPRGRVGMVTALADRIDTLVGIFGLGKRPTGSRDPFGLRRAAQSAVRIVLHGDLELDLELVAARAVRLYDDNLKLGSEEILGSLRPFFHDRVRYLLGLEGYAYDEIEAALAAGGVNLPDLRARVRALHETREKPGFLAVVLSAKRILNIIRDSAEAELDPELLVEPAEVELDAAATELRNGVDEAEARDDYVGGLELIAEFSDVLDRFFVEVLVMDENKELRRNRIALLQRIHRTLSRTARLTEMVVDRSEGR